jgi:hypothetical protein
VTLYYLKMVHNLAVSPSFPPNLTNASSLTTGRINSSPVVLGFPAIGMQRLTCCEASGVVVAAAANLVRFYCFSSFNARLKIFGRCFLRQRKYLEMMPNILRFHSYYSQHCVAQYIMRYCFILSVNTREAKINIVLVVPSCQFSAFRCICITGN